MATLETLPALQFDSEELATSAEAARLAAAFTGSGNTLTINLEDISRVVEEIRASHPNVKTLKLGWVPERDNLSETARYMADSLRIARSFTESSKQTFQKFVKPSDSSVRALIEQFEATLKEFEASMTESRSSVFSDIVLHSLDAVELEEGELPPTHASRQALHTLAKLAFSQLPDLLFPHVAPLGDGDCMAEWRHENKHITTLFSDSGQTYLHKYASINGVLTRCGDIHSPEPEQIKEAFAWLIETPKP